MDKRKQEEIRNKWAQIVAKAWTDENFKKRLMKNPEQVLKEYSIDPIAGEKLAVLEDSRQTRHLIIPRKPEGNLTEAELKSVAAGSGSGVCSTLS